MQFNYDLSNLNTLKLPAKAHAFATFKNEQELQQLLNYAREHSLTVKVLGGGSNVLFTHDIDALVIQSQMHRVSLLEQTADFSRVAVDAGVVWHDWVRASVEFGHGLENLALIPGTVGAAPVQNIGAYGVDVGGFLETVEGFYIGSSEHRILSASECRFAYRDSIFKQELAGQFVITRVVFKLPRAFNPVLNYGPLAQLHNVTPSLLIDAVCAIRQEKLPDPNKIPNAGSFFKNPVVSTALAHSLKQQYSDLPLYPQDANQSKLAAGWLIEQAGWKGKWLGSVRMHDQQALVLTTNGNATYADVEALSKAVVESVKNTFGVELEPEPQPF